MENDQRISSLFRVTKQERVKNLSAVFETLELRQNSNQHRQQKTKLKDEKVEHAQFSQNPYLAVLSLVLLFKGSQNMRHTDIF